MSYNFIAQDIELVNPEFSTIETQQMYRANIKGSRYYFNKYEDSIQLYPSVTHITDAMITDKYVLIELLDSLGKDKYYEMMRTKACYGTIMHRAVNEYLLSGDNYNNREINSERINEIIIEEADKSRIDEYIRRYWLEDMKADVKCMIMFLAEHNVEPLAIEIMGCYNDEKYKFAGAIDLICKMDIEVKGFFGEVYKTGEKKGQPKESKRVDRIIAIVDYKSGKKGFYRGHEVQINMYKMIVEQMGVKVDKCFNVSPNETSTNYKMKDQTNVASKNKINGLLQAFYEDYKEPSEIKFIPDVLKAETQYIILDIKEHLYNMILKREEQLNTFKIIA